MEDKSVDKENKFVIPNKDDVQIIGEQKKEITLEDIKESSRKTDEVMKELAETIDDWKPNEQNEIDHEKFKQDLKKDLIEELPEVRSHIENTGFNVSRRNVHPMQGENDAPVGDAKGHNNKDVFKIDKNKKFNKINSSIFNQK